MRPADAVGVSSLGCAYVDGHGEKCRYPGSMSTNTTGGGPWFCRTHFYDQGSQAADRTVTESQRYAPAWMDGEQVRKVALANFDARRKSYGMVDKPGSGPKTKEEVLAMLRKFAARGGRG